MSVENLANPIIDPVVDSAVYRDESGQILPGSHLNPAGRKKGSKNRLTELRQSLEIAVREGVDPKKIADVFTKMIDLATEGNTRAAKLVLDKTIANNADPREDKEEVVPQYVFVIENATIQQNIPNSKEPANIIDVTPVDSSAELLGTAVVDNTTPIPT